MKDEIMLLLGCGLTALLVTNACSSMYENESDDENEYDGRRGRKYSMRRNRYEDCEGYNGCSSSTPMPPAPVPQEKFSVDYYSADTKPKEPSTYSPLMFGGMVTNEPYIESDYIPMKQYLDNPDDIKTYNEKDGSVGLPVTDMTSVSAGENNKYIYDRTIGTIGFTSTKIGGRFRGQADYIRGDIAVLPDKTGWFQVSSDPANKLMLGAMNVANGIGQNTSSSSGSGGLNNLSSKGPMTLNSLRAEKATDDKKRANAANTPGMSALNNLPPYQGPDVLQIMQAGYNQAKQDAARLGTSYTAGNPY